MRAAPRVSVVTPAYNCQATLEAAVASVRAQTMPDWEMLIVDDGSTDGTAALARRLAAEDARIKPLLGAANAGPAAARNRGIEAAEGACVAFLDADDTWMPDKLERQLAALESAGADVCYCGYGFMDENGRACRPPYRVPPVIDYKGMLVRNVFSCTTVLIRRQALGARRFDGSFAHEDYALWLRLMRDGCTAVGIPEPLAMYRAGGRNQNKGHAVVNRWRVYRRGEGMAPPKAAWYLLRYALASLVKYGKKQ